jgi:hypothetical protein
MLRSVIYFFSPGECSSQRPKSVRMAKTCGNLRYDCDTSVLVHMDNPEFRVATTSYWMMGDLTRKLITKVTHKFPAWPLNTRQLSRAGFPPPTGKWVDLSVQGIVGDVVEVSRLSKVDRDQWMWAIANAVYEQSTVPLNQTARRRAPISIRVTDCFEWNAREVDQLSSRMWNQGTARLHLRSVDKMMVVEVDEHKSRKHRRARTVQKVREEVHRWCFWGSNPDAYKSVGKARGRADARAREGDGQYQRQLDARCEEWYGWELSMSCAAHLYVLMATTERSKSSHNKCCTSTFESEQNKLSNLFCSRVHRGGNESPGGGVQYMHARWCTSSKWSRAGTSLLLCAKNAAQVLSPGPRAERRRLRSWVRPLQRPRKVWYVRNFRSGTQTPWLATLYGAHLSPTRYLFLPRSKSMLLPSGGAPFIVGSTTNLHMICVSTRGMHIANWISRAMTGTPLRRLLGWAWTGYVRLVVPQCGRLRCRGRRASSPPRTQATISWHRPPSSWRSSSHDPRLWRSCQWRLRSAFGVAHIMCMYTLCMSGGEESLGGEDEGTPWNFSWGDGLRSRTTCLAMKCSG